MPKNLFELRRLSNYGKSNYRELTVPLVCPFLLTETSLKESIQLTLFDFSDNMSYFCKRIL